jgi:hypothetical protein
MGRAARRDTSSRNGGAAGGSGFFATRAQLEAARRELERAKTDLVETLASSSGRDGPPASFVDALGDIQFLWFADHRGLGAAASVSKHWKRLAAAPGLWGSLVEARWPGAAPADVGCARRALFRRLAAPPRGDAGLGGVALFLEVEGPGFAARRCLPSLAGLADVAVDGGPEYAVDLPGVDAARLHAALKCGACVARVTFVRKADGAAFSAVAGKRDCCAKRAVVKCTVWPKSHALVRQRVASYWQTDDEAHLHLRVREIDLHLAHERAFPGRLKLSFVDWELYFVLFQHAPESPRGLDSFWDGLGTSVSLATVLKLVAFDA